MEIKRPDSGLDETLLFIKFGCALAEEVASHICRVQLRPTMVNVAIVSSYDNISLSKDTLLSCPAATASELFQEKFDLAYLPVPIQEEHANDSDRHVYRSVNPTQPGLDIGYVPAGPHAFLRLSGQFGPPQFIFHWPEGPVFFFFFFFFSASYAAIIFTGNRQNSEGNVNSYLFFVIYRPNVQKCATSRVKS